MGMAPGGAEARAIDRAVDLALAAAERELGFGRAVAAPGWVRDRVLAILQDQASRRGLTMFAAAEHLKKDRAAVEEIVAALRVGETHFYRDPVTWEAITSGVLPSLPNRPIAGLSAGCSTGEEAYTLGMILASAGRRFSVLGVDRSREAVEAAREATYSAEAANRLPPAYVQRFCEVQGGVLRVRKELRSVVTFEVCDLVAQVPSGGFHIILFKNVLLYLASPAGEEVARKLCTELDARGVLFTAASEVPRLCGAGLAGSRISATVTAFRAPGRSTERPPGAAPGGAAEGER